MMMAARTEAALVAVTVVTLTVRTMVPGTRT